jgi:uncharacterized protein YjdB
VGTRNWAEHRIRVLISNREGPTLAVGMRRVLSRLVFSLLLLSGLSACNGFFVPETLSSIQVSPQNGSVPVGGTVQFSALGVNNVGSTSLLTNVTWTSSNTQVATISASGLATGVSAGTTTITATSGNLSGTSTLTVGSGGSSGTLFISPANQTVSSSLGAVQFTAAFNGQDVTASSIWSSSNPAVAQFILGSGVASLVGQGTTTITATLTTTSGTVTGSTILIVGP